MVELLVVIVIIAVMASLGFVGTVRFIENGRRVSAANQFKEFRDGLTLYTSDYNHPPLSDEKRAAGEDTVFGVSKKDPQYSNGFLIAVLAGESENIPYKTSKYDISEVNPRGESLMQFTFNPNKKNGVGPDGIFYDPWGKEIMVAVNAFQATSGSDALMEENPGSPGINDNHLETYFYGEYKDKKPRDEAFVFWTYGKDGKKGNGTVNPQKVVIYAKTDDVVSW